MCRVMLYMGKQTISANDFLFAPDNSLIKQSYSPMLMSSIQNLAGFGMIGWNYHSPQAKVPFYYKTANLPFFDANLLNLSDKVEVNCMMAHVRGVEYNTEQIVIRENAHPFLFPGYTVALSHNGNIADMYLLKRALVPYTKPEVTRHIVGTTDSEWIYAVFCSQLKDPYNNVSVEEARDAVVKTLQIIRKARISVENNKASPVNLFITNGEYLIVTRFVFDYGCNSDRVEEAFLEYHSLWLTYGDHYDHEEGTYKMKGAEKRNNILFASEPLTEDRTTWIELPEYSLTTAWFGYDEVRLQTDDLDV